MSFASWFVTMFNTANERRRRWGEQREIRLSINIPCAYVAKAKEKWTVNWPVALVGRALNRLAARMTQAQRMHIHHSYFLAAGLAGRSVSRFVFSLDLFLLWCGVYFGVYFSLLLVFSRSLLYSLVFLSSSSIFAAWLYIEYGADLLLLRPVTSSQ